MSGSVNKVILLGNLGKDPEVGALQNGDRVVRLSLATSDRWKDKSTGEQRERTEWHRIVIFNEPLGRIAEQYLKKGSTIYIEGQLQTRKWQDSNGADKYTTEIVLQNYRGELLLLDRVSENSINSFEDQDKLPAQKINESSNKTLKNELDNLEDDIPF